MQSKDRILQAAESLFFRKGYRQTTTKEIAKHADVSEALLFKYFRNKEGLLQAVLHATLENFQVSSQAMVEDIISKPIPPREKLALLVRNRYDFFMDNFEETSIIIRQMQFDPLLKAKVVVLLNEKIDPILTSLLRSWYQSIRKPYNPIALALVKGIIFDIMLQRAIFDTSRPFEDVQKHLDVVLKGLSHE